MATTQQIEALRDEAAERVAAREARICPHVVDLSGKRVRHVTDHEREVAREQLRDGWAEVRFVVATRTPAIGAKRGSRVAKDPRLIGTNQRGLYRMEVYCRGRGKHYGWRAVGID